MHILRKLFYSLSLLLGIIFFNVSCEYDADGDNYHYVEKLPAEVGIAINLADYSPDDVIYIYGPTYFHYQIVPEIGSVKSVEFTFDGGKTEIWEDQGYMKIEPDEVEDKMLNLTVDVTIDAKDKSLAGTVLGFSYAGSLSYKVKYVHITAEDFSVVKMEVDKVTFSMVNKNENPCQYVIDGKLVTDLDKIEFPRNDFPYGFGEVKIYLLPPDARIADYKGYNYIPLRAMDNTLEGIPSAMNIEHSFGMKDNTLYTYYGNDVFVYDENLFLINKKAVDVSKIAVTQKNGLVACYSYGKIITYSDYTFSTVVSTIDNAFPTLEVTEKDQMFWINNFQVDAFDLHTGNLVYSIDCLPNGVWDIAASVDGKYLYVQTSEGQNIYSLSDNAAILLYALDKRYDKSFFHPVNKNHLVLQSRFEGFDVYDVEARKVVFHGENEVQSVDPVTGVLLYYDKDYDTNYENRFVDKSYNEIYVLENNTYGLYGAFKLFNNHLIKSTYFVDISSKLWN